jgi:hypothetical protein
MTKVSQVFAGIAGVLFVITAVFALLFVNATRVITDRDALKEALGLETVLRESMPELVNAAVAEQVAVRNIPLPEFIDVTGMTEKALAAMPAGWLDSATESAVDGVFDYLLTGDAETAVVVLDMNGMMTQLQGEPGRQLVLEYLNALPFCKPLELLNLLSGAIPTCVPEGMPLDELSYQLHGLLTPMLRSQISIGEGGIVSVPLEPLLSASPEILQMVERVRFFYQLSGQVWVLWLLPLFCLLLIAAVVVRTFWQWGIWWGWPLSAAGVVGLLFSGLLPGFVLGWLRTSVFSASITNPISTLWQTLLLQGIVNLSDSWASRVAWQSAALLILGILFLLYGYVTKRSFEQDTLIVDKTSS